MRDHLRVSAITIDFSNLPSDTALLLAQQRNTLDLATDLANATRLDDEDRQLLRDELIGTVAEAVEAYLP